MQDLHEVSDSELAVPFLTCWTRKEACLKALGVGLTVEPKAVHVGIRPLRSQARIPEVGACESVEVASPPSRTSTVSRHSRSLADTRVPGCSSGSRSA